MAKTKLELTWIGKDTRPKLEPPAAHNGWPPPKYYTDEGRTRFLVVLPLRKAFTGKVESQVGTKLALSGHQVTAQVAAMLKAAKSPCTRDELQAAAGIAHREHFRKQYLLPLLEAGLIEMTIPDKPRSSKQKYRLTPSGRDLLSSQKTEN